MDEKIKPIHAESSLPGRWRQFLWLVPLLLGTLVYLNALANGFAGDDPDIIVNFPLIRDIRNIPLFFAMQDTLADGGETGYYRPLGRLVYMLDYQLWGLNPLGYHLFNLLLHLLTVSGWYLVVRRLSGVRPAVILAVTLFAVAPVNVESVTYVTGRNNVQVACLLVFSFLAYLKREERGAGEGRWRWQALSLVLFALALLTKEFAVFFPLVLLAASFLPALPHSRAGWRRTTARLVPYLALTAAYLVVRSIVIGSSRSGLPAITPGSIADAIRGVASYLRLLLAPVNLSVTHDIAFGDSLLHWGGMAALLLLAGLLVALLAAVRYDRTIAFFLAWFLVFLFPVSGILGFNPVPVAERYLYVASLGGYAALALAAERIGRRYRFLALSLLSLLVGAFALRTVVRNRDWRDDLTLAQSTVKSNPDSPVAFLHLGNAYFSRERNREALEAYRRSVELNDSFPHSRMNLARTYHLEGMLDEAIREYRASLEMMPDNHQLHRAIADAYYQKGMRKEALQHLERSVSLHWDPDTAHNLELLQKEINSAKGDN